MRKQERIEQEKSKQQNGDKGKMRTQRDGVVVVMMRNDKSGGRKGSKKERTEEEFTKDMRDGSQAQHPPNAQAKKRTRKNNDRRETIKRKGREKKRKKIDGGKFRDEDERATEKEGRGDGGRKDGVS